MTDCIGYHRTVYEAEALFVEIVVRVAETHTAARFHVHGAFTLVVRFTPDKARQAHTLPRFVKRPS